MELMFRLETLLQSGVQTRMSCDISKGLVAHLLFQGRSGARILIFFFKGVFPGCWQGSLKIKLTEPQKEPHLTQ